jgi:hypothetical protein
VPVERLHALHAEEVDAHGANPTMAPFKALKAAALSGGC